MGKASTRAQNRYIAKTYDRVNLTLPKGQKEVVQLHASALGESVNGFIGRAISEAMERDGGGTAPSGPQEAAGTAQEAGVVSLPSDALGTAQGAAKRTGEAPAVFIARAIDTQAKRDKTSLLLGINPATGEKLNQNSEGGTDHE